MHKNLMILYWLRVGNIYLPRWQVSSDKWCLQKFWRFKAGAEIVNFIWLLFIAKLYSSIFYGNYGNIQLFNIYILVHYEIPF